MHILIHIKINTLSNMPFYDSSDQKNTQPNMFLNALNGSKKNL